MTRRYRIWNRFAEAHVASRTAESIVAIVVGGTSEAASKFGGKPMLEVIIRTTDVEEVPQVHVCTVSHTLEVELAERLKLFAFKFRISESAIMEHALINLLKSEDPEVLASTLRKAGRGLKRKTVHEHRENTARAGSGDIL